MRIKIVKEYRGYHIGETHDVIRPYAELLIKKGIAIRTKDITTSDMRTT